MTEPTDSPPLSSDPAVPPRDPTPPTEPEPSAESPPESATGEASGETPAASANAEPESPKPDAPEPGSPKATEAGTEPTPEAVAETPAEPEAEPSAEEPSAEETGADEPAPSDSAASVGTELEEPATDGAAGQESDKTRDGGSDTAGGPESGARAKAPRSRKRKPGESVGERLAMRRAEQNQAQALLFKAWARRISTILIIIMAGTIVIGPFVKTLTLRFVAGSVEDPAWFHWAVQKLEESNPESAVDLYVTGLSTADPNHRFHYHAWIQEHAGEAHRETILDAARSSDAERRRAGLRAVYILIDHDWMRTREVYQLIADRLREDPDQRCRTFASLCLEKNGRKPPAVVRPALHDALNDPYASVRVNSLRVLSRFARAEDEAAFAGCLKDPVAEVRWAAAAALARLGRPSSVRVLAERANTSTADGRREVLKVLGDIRHPSATRLLLSLTNDIEDDIAAQAIRLLADRPGAEVDAALLGALRVRNPRIRTAATRVVGDRGMTPAVPRLIENLSSYDNWSELEALDAALHKLTQATGIPAPSGDEASRRATIQAWRAWAKSHETE